MRVYHFLKSEHGLDNLRHRRLKVAEIDKLNDPFELLGVASRDPNVRRRYRQMKDGFAKFMGLLCFSENWRNPVQWSHYADLHRGLCFGFDVSADADLKKVHYEKTRLKPRTRSLKKEGKAAEKHTTDIITTKFEHWAYEQEHRLFVNLQDRDDETGYYWYNFSTDLILREVIIGASSKITRRNILEALSAQDRSVRIWNARLAFQTFEVVKQNDKKFWT